MTISLREIFGIYRDTVSGLKQNSLPAEYDHYERTFPRDPIFIARGLEAAFGFRISFAIVDFYRNVNIPDDRKDFFSFYEYRTDDQVKVFLNSTKLNDGSPLISQQTLRFVVLKELFTAVIRKALIQGLVSERHPDTLPPAYPDTVTFGEFISAHLDWISEKFSVYAFDDDEYSPTVSVENAAELLAIMFLIDLPALYEARRQLDIQPKGIWKLEQGGDIPHDSPEADLKFSLFDYEKHAADYGVKVRFVVVLIKTDFILKIMDGLKSIVSDIKELFSMWGN
jgi:hypothetical protein